MTVTAVTKAPGRTAIQRKLEHLNALIGHAGTPEAEVAAAKAMRARLVKALAEAGPEAAPGYQWEPNWAGAKYVRGEHMPTTQIAALIRAEIKVARALGKIKPQAGEVAVPDPVLDPIANAPAGVKFGVRVPHYGSITITVKNAPRDWGYGEYGEDWHGSPCEAPSPALYELGEALASLGNQWNYDNSDTMTDYFDRRYYLNVVDEDGHGIEHMPARYRYRHMS